MITAALFLPPLLENPELPKGTKHDRERIRKQSGEGEELELSKRATRIEMELRLAAVRADRSEIFRKLRAKRLGSEIATKLVRELDMLEARYAG